MKNLVQTLGIFGLLMLLAQPVVGIAANLGEKTVFLEPRTCEYIDIEKVEFLRTDDAFLVLVEYHLHDDLTKQQIADLGIISFHLMPDAQSTEFPEGGIGGTTGRVDGNHSEVTKTGVSYFDHQMWQPVSSIPERIYLRPFYKFMGEWGDVLVFEVTPDEVQAIENAADIPEV